MKKYRAVEDIKQGDECLVSDGVIHRLESGWCECEYPSKEHKSICGKCSKPIKPKRELPEKLNEPVYDDSNFRSNVLNKINEIITYLEAKDA